MQDGTPQHSALPPSAWLDSHFTDRGLGDYQQNGFREVPVLLLVTYFCGVGPKGKLLIKTKKTM
jgi:hypothetical protein